jgi:hypothetical protein
MSLIKTCKNTKHSMSGPYHQDNKKDRCLDKSTLLMVSKRNRKRMKDEKRKNFLLLQSPNLLQPLFLQSL